MKTEPVRVEKPEKKRYVSGTSMMEYYEGICIDEDTEDLQVMFVYSASEKRLYAYTFGTMVNMTASDIRRAFNIKPGDGTDLVKNPRREFGGNCWRFYDDHAPTVPFLRIFILTETPDNYTPTFVLKNEPNVAYGAWFRIYPPDMVLTKEGFVTTSLHACDMMLYTRVMEGQHKAPPEGGAVDQKNPL